MTRVTVPDEQHRENLMSHGLPEPVAQMLVGAVRRRPQSEFAAADPTLERLLGRPPISMRDVLSARISSEQKS